jgi:hypothetical protein
MSCVPGTISPGIKRPGREPDHSLPSGAEVKNSGAIPPLLNTPSWSDAQLSTGITLSYPQRNAVTVYSCRSQWSSGLRHGMSSPAQTL